jgi:SnoaL-like domain
MTDADVLPRMLYAIDVLDWPGVRDAFADEVRADWTSLFGGEPETLPAEELIARWQALLPGFDATQHMLGPMVLTDDGGAGVRADAHVRGYHHIEDRDGGRTWAVHGHYTARLVDGKITELTLAVFYQEGELGLPAVATERAAASPRQPAASRVPGRS